jgi:hypothetical protein
MLHPSRRHRYQSRFWRRSLLYSLWIEYVPLWVDTALVWLFWGLLKQNKPATMEPVCLYSLL